MAKETGGYIAIHRSLKKHWIWQDPIKLKWWLDILLEVNHAPNSVTVKFELFECKRGQSVRSLETWAKDWRSDKSTVRRFFNLLQKDGMIVIENLKKTTRLTVCNYDSYNNSKHTTETQQKRHATADETPRNPNNKGNNDKNDKNDKEDIHNAILQKWNQWAELHEKPQAVKLSEVRKKHLNARLKEATFDLDKILEIASGSNYITKPDSAWFSFDWIISSENNYLKVLEGKYGYTPHKTYTPTDKDSWI